MTTTTLDRPPARQPASGLVTRGDVHLRLRRVMLTDGPMLAEFFARLAPADRRFRFLEEAPGAQAPSAPDTRRSEHLIAFDTSTGEVVASVLFHADPASDSSEVAIAIAAPWRRRGVGWTLLRHAADLAFVRGARTLRCIEDRAKHDAVEVERTPGFQARALASHPGSILLEARLG